MIVIRTVNSRKWPAFFIVLNFLMMLSCPCGADDTEIYSSGASLKPMVLLIVDNSGSMADSVPYDSSTTYTGSYDSTAIYKKTCSRYNRRHVCTQTTLSVYTGTFTDTDGDGIDDYNTTIIAGNRLNYDSSTSTSKISSAKTVLKSLVELMYDQVEFGLMKFNYQDGGNLIAPIGASKATLLNSINNITASTWTPLAESLATAGEYFEGKYTGQSSPWDEDNWCQQAFVIIITDGEPTYDTSKTIIGHFLGTSCDKSDIGQCWDQDGDYYNAEGYENDVDVWVEDNHYSTIDSNGRNQTFLDDLSHYLYRHDLRSDLSGTQNITTYTIGFAHTSDLLENTAANAGGEYFTANSASELENNLLSALDDISSKLQSYTAPVVPVTKTSSGDRMYLAFFKPKNYETFWAGDLQKYALSDSNEIIDSKGNEATDSDGALLDTAVPYWSVDELLQSRTSARNIYTYLGTDTDLTDDANAFSTSNGSLTAALLDNPAKLAAASDSTTARNDLINYIHGYDAYDEDEDSDYTEKKDYVLGDVLHSVPLVVDYAASSSSNPNRYIFFGSNDGMLHCIKDSDGSEAWAFIPPDALGRLKLFKEGSSHPYFVDGSPKLYEERNTSDEISKAIIIFGERAGGDNYYALDVSTPTSPKLLWRINSSTTGFSELGQTWSDPVIAAVKKKISSVETTCQAAIFGAGFDSSQSGETDVSDASIGRGVYIVNVLTGALLKSFTNADYSGMTYSIPSMVLTVDQTYDGTVDRIYVGDTGGNLWRIGAAAGTSGTVDDWDLMDNWKVRKLFASNPGADSSEGRKIYYPPDVAIMTDYLFLYFGTGDRDNPRSEATVDRVYGIKDYSLSDSSFTTLTESNLMDQTGVETSYEDLSASGWYFRLTNSGEKVLAVSTLFNSYVLTTTFTPNSASCGTGGDSKLYATYYLSGTTTYYSLGNGIPTEVVLVVTSSGTTAFVGIGSGIKDVSDLTPDSDSVNQTPISDVLDLNRGIKVISWREVF